MEKETKRDEKGWRRVENRGGIWGKGWGDGVEDCTGKTKNTSHPWLPRCWQLLLNEGECGAGAHLFDQVVSVPAVGNVKIMNMPFREVQKADSGKDQGWAEVFKGHIRARASQGRVSYDWGKLFTTVRRSRKPGESLTLFLSLHPLWLESRREMWDTASWHHARSHSAKATSASMSP